MYSFPSQLRVLSVAHCTEATISGVRSLIDLCPHLEAVGDLECFTKIAPDEIADLSKWIGDNNLELSLEGGVGGGESNCGVYLESAIM